MDPEEFWRLLKKEGVLTPRLSDEFVRIYGDRGQKALHALKNGMVRKYLDFVVVAGTSQSYVVEEDFCTCRDFVFRGKCCWHLLAARLARICGGYAEREEWYQDTWGI